MNTFFMLRVLDKTLFALQKRFGVDLRYVVTNGSWLLTGQIITLGLSLVSATIFARFLTNEMYGNYAYIIAMSNILAIATLPGMNTALTQAVARGFEGSFRKILITKIQWSILGMVAAFGLAAYYMFNDNFLFGYAFLLMAPFFPIMYPFGIYSSFLEGKKNFALAAKLNVLGRIFTLLPLIAVIILTRNVLVIVGTYFVAWTIVRSIFLFFILKKYYPNKQEDISSVSFGKHLSVLDGMDIFGFYIDRIIIFHFLGAVEVAVYSFAVFPIDYMRGFIFKNLGMLALPRFAEQSEEIVKKGLFKKTLKLLPFSIVFAILYIVLAPFFYDIFFPQYHSSIIFSQVLAIMLVILPFGNFVVSFLDAHKKIRAKYISRIITNVSQIILPLILVFPYGLWGVVIGKIISLIVAVISVWMVCLNRDAPSQRGGFS